MNRSGYVDGCDLESHELNLYRGRVTRALRGKRGQAFLRELAQQLDAMPEKRLIADELVNEDGDCCTIGVVCKARGVDVSQIDYECPEQVGAAVGIAQCMAAEIEYENDDDRCKFERDSSGEWHRIQETPEQRWTRMRKWVESQIIK